MKTYFSLNWHLKIIFGVCARLFEPWTIVVNDIVQVLSKGLIILSDTRSAPSAKTRHEFELTVTDQTAQLLSPTARVIVWCVTSDGEVITDSLEVSIDAAFANQVTAAFDRKLNLT